MSQVPFLLRHIGGHTAKYAEADVACKRGATIVDEGGEVMTRKILVTGATGMVSGALLEALDGADVAIRALVREGTPTATFERRGIAVAIGDLDDPESLTPAFEGVDDVWLLNSMSPRASENSMNAVWAARQAGVERVVRLSALRASHDAPTRNGRLHAMADLMLEDPGMRWTIVRAHAFMQNLLWQAESIATRGEYYLNMAQGRLGMVDVRDVADLAARVLRDEPERHHGRIYTPTGPAAITYAEAANQLAAALGRDIRYIAVSAEDARRSMLRGGLSSWLAGMLVEYGQALGAGWGDFTTSDFEAVVGRPPRAFADFARDHAAAFGLQRGTRRSSARERRSTSSRSRVLS
jgi:uncharacterized protein YbjT (DUF2867 family)